MMLCRAEINANLKMSQYIFSKIHQLLLKCNLSAKIKILYQITEIAVSAYRVCFITEYYGDYRFRLQRLLSQIVVKSNTLYMSLALLNAVKISEH